MATDDVMNEVARDWLAARQVIIDFLREVGLPWTQEVLEHNAAAIIARMAHLDPPLLIHRGRDHEDTLALCREVLAWLEYERREAGRRYQDTGEDYLGGLEEGYGAAAMRLREALGEDDS